MALTFPSKGIFLGQAYVGEDAVGEFMRHLIQARGMVIERGYERKNGSARIGRERHVAKVNFIERRLAQA